MSEIAEFNLNAADSKPITAEGLAGWIAEARAMLKLAAPLMVTQLAQMAIMTTDIVMLGRLSATALAAATLGNTVFVFAWLIGFGALLSVLIAVPLAALAATKRDRIPDHVVRSVPLVGLVCPPSWVGLWLLLVFGVHLGRPLPVGG